MSLAGHYQPTVALQNSKRTSNVSPRAFTSRRLQPSHLFTHKNFAPTQQRNILTRAAEVPAGQDPEKFAAANKQYAQLTEKIETVSATVAEQLQGTSLYLVGMMGSGKSTVAKMLSQALGYCFFDSDDLIEQLAKKSIPDIINQDGEDDFRDIESQVLGELMPFKSCVVATGGGAVIRPQNWSSMQQGGIVVWLNGPPSLLAHRVVADGVEGRPLLANSDGSLGSSDAGEEYQRVTQKLTEILEKRRDLYALSDIVVSLEGDGPTADLGIPAAEVVYRVLAALNDRISRDTKMREEQQKFEVVNENRPPTMRTVKSINPVGGDMPENGADPYLP